MTLSWAAAVIELYVLLAMLGSWIYFRRYQIVRPPIGVLTLGDVAFMVAAIVVVPYLYLALPHWLLAGLLLAGAAGGIYFTLEPVVRVRWALRLLTLCMVATELAIWHSTPHNELFFALNNAVQILIVVGVANLWAQSGMKARDAAVLGMALTLYDFLFTAQLPLMADLFAHLAGLPFAPLVAWPVASPDLWFGIGLGDLLLAAAFPLLMHKAFGRSAGVVTLVINLATLTFLQLLPSLGMQSSIFPVMVVLGPLMGLQYAFWRHRCGLERTTWQYWQAEPLPPQKRMAAISSGLSVSATRSGDRYS